MRTASIQSILEGVRQLAEHREDVAEAVGQRRVDLVLDRAGVAQAKTWTSSRAWPIRCTRPLRCSSRDGFQGKSMLTCAPSR